MNGMALTDDKSRAFDLHPFVSASLADLSLFKFLDLYLPAAVRPEILAANQRTVEQRLAAQKMVMTSDQPVPTVLGVLVLGRSVTDLIPGAYINFLRVDGVDITGPVIDNLRIEGTVDDVIRRTEEKLESHNRTAVEFRGRPLEVRQSTYPMEAIRQILRNAIMHRTYEGTHAPVKVTWYNDRLEFHNPGGPYGQVSVETFGTSDANDYRNPNLAEAMRVLDLVQKFGYGIQAAKSELSRNGNPPPEFVATREWCKVVFRPAAPERA